MKTIELHQAFAWDCDCGQANYCNGITPDLTEEEDAELRDHFGLSPWQEGCWLVAPEIVKCKNCGEKYLAHGC